MTLVKFRVYFTWYTFVVTIKKNDLPPAVARWVVTLQEYTFTVEHRKHEQMEMRHVPSRCYTMHVVQEEIIIKIKKAQQED